MTVGMNGSYRTDAYLIALCVATLLIDSTMERWTKTRHCVLVLAATPKKVIVV
jgi:hypothetical protein